MTIRGPGHAQGTDPGSGSLQVQIEAAPTLSLAMVANAVPVVARLSLTNHGPHALTDLTVELALLPDYSEKWSTHVSTIPAGGTFHVDDVDLPLDRTRLVNQLERSSAELRVWVRRGEDKPLATHAQSVDVLAYNEWSRATVPQILAAFVLPNHPLIAELLHEASTRVQERTGSPALDGYQSGEPRRVLAIAQAIYEALGARGVTYSNPPASFEKQGQKIRTPEQVLGEKLATCLDVSVLVAAALEQSGLNPLIALVQGHAFPAVWLEDSATPEGYIDDRATFKKLVDLGRIAVFDSSAAVARPPVPFADAARTAARMLESDSFHHAVDVTGARKQHYRPLPLRVAGGYSAVVEVPVSALPSGASAAPRPTSSEGARGRERSNARARHPRIDAWKQRLLDMSLRNRLLNFKDTKQSLDFVFPEGAVLENVLAEGGKLTIRARTSLFGEEDPRSKKLLEARVPGDPLDTYLRERLTHGELYTAHPDDATNAKLVTIYRAAREMLEETGTNALCLTLGMLEWYESDTSEHPRRAPILLVPVTLERSARAGYKLSASDEDPRLNVTLIEKLRRDHGIELPELSELPLDQAGVDVAAVLRSIRNAVLRLRRWDVKDGIHLGLFAFAKFQMWADLENNAEVLLENPLIKHLLEGKGEPYPNSGAFPDPAALDSTYSPKDLVCPLDGDASQLAAVAAAAEGKTFVLQGPPGTGKSQTITNLITHCITQGKRVLFVAEKAAALEVVQRRLTQIGLGPYVLELHSHKSGKQQVLDQFRAALDAEPAAPPPSWETDTRSLAAERDHLNLYVKALHQPRPGGGSIFRALSRLMAVRDAPHVLLPATCAASDERFSALRLEADNLSHAARELHPLATSPWHGCKLPVWDFDLPTRVQATLESVRARLEDARAASAELARALGASNPRSLGDVDSLCGVACLLAEAPAHGAALTTTSVDAWPNVEREARDLVTLAQTRADALARLRVRYQDTLFELDLDALAARTRKYAHAFFLIAWWALRGVRQLLRRVTRDGALPARAELADDLALAQVARERATELSARNARGLAIYGAAWRAGDSDPASLEGTLAWANKLYEHLGAARHGLLGSSFGPLEGRSNFGKLANAAKAKLSQLRAGCDELGALLGCEVAQEGDASGDIWESLSARLERWQADVARLPFYHAYLKAADALKAAGCDALVEAAVKGALAPGDLPRAFERGALHAWLGQAISEEPILQSFIGEHHHRRIRAFADLDHAHLEACAKVARARLFERAPTATVASGGERGVLQNELNKKRKHKPIRKLVAEIPTLAARLKPCFLMSPMSVATYLDPRTTRFDVVVFDEASQIPTYDAIGVLARGTSAVVVGDSKQLPPTAFFQSGEGGDGLDEGAVEELESILDECRSSGFPERRLDWHYRSRHESLIAFSNYHYYNNRLNTFPSAAERGVGRGVTLRTVRGFYDKGGARTNRAEAEALVTELVARLRAQGDSKRSYGVVTFSQAQQQLVLDLLEQACRQYPEIEPFFSDALPERVIVKNLENIQGDERDVMLFSICYGPDQNGKFSMNFGPLNRDGGERRLNVAITRAREELVVFATLLPEQIDLTRTKAAGVKHLKTFLDYARRGPAAIAEALTVSSGDSFDSPFEEQVCERLRERGYTVHTQVGCAGYRIDMGIVHPEEPGRYLLAVECDGAYYHSARSARERDRLRANVLEGLGWRIHRIWSTDWWQDPTRELARLDAAIAQAKAELTKSPPRAESAPKVAPPTNAQPPAPASISRPAAQQRAERVDRTPSQSAYAFAPTQPVTPWIPPVTTKSDVTAYRVAPIPNARRGPEDVHDDRFRDELQELLQSVIELEAPVALRVLARRIAPFYGIGRTTNRLEDRLRVVLGRSARIRDEIVWRQDQDPETWSEVRLAPPDAKRDVQEIPREEVANGALSVLRGSIALERDELVRLTARTLGFTRVGERVAEQMALGIRLLVERRVAHEEGEKIALR